MRTVKLNELCLMKSGGTPSRKKPEFYNGSIPWAKISDLESSPDGFVYDTEEHITNDGLASINNRLFTSNTLFLAMYGSVGKSAISKVEMSTNQAILGINIKDQAELDLYYLQYWFRTIKQKLLNRAVGGTLQNISLTIVKDLEIPLPPLEEQKKIAAILDAADDYRQKTKALIDKYDQLTQSLFLDMFGDPVTNPMGWESKKFKDFTVKYNQGVNTTTEKIKYVDEGTFPIIRAGEVGKGSLDFGSVVWVDYENESRIKETCKPIKGDVLYANIGANLGTACLVETNRAFGIAWNVFRIQLKEEVNRTFFVHQLNSDWVRRVVWSKVKSATVPFISGKQIAELNFINPPACIQSDFEERFQAIKAQKEQAQASLAQAEDLFNSLLQKAFKGELTN